MFWLLLSRPGGPGTRDVASGQILPNLFQGVHSCWRSSHLSGAVAMIVSAKDPSVRPSLKKHYVFNYSALSEIWIGSGWLHKTSVGKCFALCWLTVSSGRCWDRNVSNNSCSSHNAVQSLHKMILHCQGMGIVFGQKCKTEVMGYCPSPLFQLSITSVQSCNLSLLGCTSGCGEGWGEDVSCSGSQLVSGPSTKLIPYLLL